MWAAFKLALVLAMVPAEAFAADSFVERPAATSSRDVKIPRALVHYIETQYRSFLEKNDSDLGTLGDGRGKPDIKRKLLNMSVELTQKQPVALQDNTRVVTPVGGGVVDLSDIVTPLRGAFSMKLLARREDGSEPVGLRLFYVSKAQKRMIDGDEYGVGCDKYMEITSYYQKRGASHGFDLYSTDQRYLSVIGGTFVAVVFEKPALYVGSVTFTDSRYPKLLCE